MKDKGCAYLNKPEILIEQPTEAFANCWLAAARHLYAHSSCKISWFKKELKAPFFEHLSFALDNQAYFIRVVDADGLVPAPGLDDAVKYIAKGWDGIPCIMPMRFADGSWTPVSEGYGLRHAETDEVIIPDDYKPDGPVPMTAWELQDFGVKVVINHLENDLGYEVLMSQSHPDLSPSIWFKGEHGNEWVVVHTSAYPDKKPIFEYDVQEVAEDCAKSLWGIVGHLAEVCFCSSDQEFHDGAKPLPLFRGKGAGLKFEGLKQV